MGRTGAASTWSAHVARTQRLLTRQCRDLTACRELRAANTGKMSSFTSLTFSCLLVAGSVRSEIKTLEIMAVRLLCHGSSRAGGVRDSHPLPLLRAAAPHHPLHDIHDHQGNQGVVPLTSSLLAVL